LRSFNIDLTSKALTPARLVTITRMDGTILRIAEAETAITVSAQAYTPLPGCEISAIKHAINGEMPSMQINFAHSVGGVIDTTELNEGFWDGAAVQVYVIDRSSISTLGDALFTGSVQPIDIDPIGSIASFDIRGVGAQSESFIQTYQPMCRTDLFSSLCQLVASSFDHTGTVGTIVDRFTITVAGLSSPPADDWFNGGVGVSASGFNFEISAWTLSTLTLKTNLPLCVSRFTAGEGLTLYPGCDKTGATCRTKFNNKINFQGEDHFLGINSIVGI